MFVCRYIRFRKILQNHNLLYVSFIFFINRNPVTPKNIISTIINTSEIKKEIEDVEYNEIKTELNANINEDVLVETEEDDGSECKKELDLDSIDMMQIPIQLDDGIDILDDVK